MLKVVDNTSNEPRTAYIKNIINGTIFKGTIGIHKDKIFVRAYDCVIELTNNSDVGGFPTWTAGNANDLKVENYRQVNATLTVEEYV